MFSLAFARAQVHLNLDVKRDGQEGLDHLMGVRHSPAGRPDLILLDLNLPRRDGREILAEIKKIEDVRIIPVIVLTTSNAEADIVTAYALGASCYLVKPDGLANLMKLAKSLAEFWQQVDVSPVPRA
jgi:CheY-like chemotaxis protein